MRFRQFASNLDMYRKVPMDLLEGTKRGSIISYVAILTMVVLFTMETLSFLNASTLQTDVSLDLNQDPKLRVNFNITMMDLSCEYATVDIVSPLGTSLNVTSHLSKYALDAEGVRQRYMGRNLQQHDIVLSDALVTETIEELHANGEDAVSLSEESLEEGKRQLNIQYGTYRMKMQDSRSAVLYPAHEPSFSTYIFYCASFQKQFSQKDIDIPICRLLCQLVQSLQGSCTNLGSPGRDNGGSGNGYSR